MLFHSSDEGVQPGLGWIGGRIRKFAFEEASRLPVPHMGWNFVRQVRASRLLNIEETNKFYFVHSYRAVDVDEDAVLGMTNYGEDFVSAVSRGNIHGVQFHPEKSHFFGMNILRSFLEG
jgi:glutamine amidotransferase